MFRLDRREGGSMHIEIDEGVWPSGWYKSKYVNYTSRG